MAVEYQLVEIDLGSGRTGTVALTSDVVGYFKMPVRTANAEARQRRRRAHTRRRYKDLNDATGDKYNVRESFWTDTPKQTQRGAGTLIRVPTALKTDNNLVRMTSMRFPSNAVIGAISNFLYEKCTANRPTFFITEANARHLVLRVTGNVNPEPTPTPPPPPAA